MNPSSENRSAGTQTANSGAGDFQWPLVFQDEAKGMPTIQTPQDKYVKSADP